MEGGRGEIVNLALGAGEVVSLTPAGGQVYHRSQMMTSQLVFLFNPGGWNHIR